MNDRISATAHLVDGMRVHVLIDGGLECNHLGISFLVALAEGCTKPGVLQDPGHCDALVLIDVEDASQEVLAVLR